VCWVIGFEVQCLLNVLRTHVWLLRLMIGEAKSPVRAAARLPVFSGVQWEPRRFGGGRGRGGRPKGSGNRVQMAPRGAAAAAAAAGAAPAEAAAAPAEGGGAAAKFSLRSIKFTGVYRSRRSQEGWRAQFCYANKVRVSACMLGSGNPTAPTAGHTHAREQSRSAFSAQNWCSRCILQRSDLPSVGSCGVGFGPDCRVPVPRPPCFRAVHPIFCLSVLSQVINLGTFATEDEAARVWNEAALLFRGAWLALGAPSSARTCQLRMSELLWVLCVAACHSCVCLHTWSQLCLFSVLYLFALYAHSCRL
jgi:hypothetical protein